MPTEQPIALKLPPGVVTNESAMAASGRYIDASWVRFWKGKPQLVGGYLSLIGGQTLIGVPRGALVWSDTQSRQLIATGTNVKLYVTADTNYTPVDVTPWRLSATGLANCIATVAGSSVVTVQYVGHAANVGEYLDISGATAGNGVDPNGSWRVESVIDADHVTFLAAAAASGTGVIGGGAVTIGFEIAPGLTDPAEGFGWGAGAWGEGTWGTPRSYTALSFSPRNWTLGNFGHILIGCPSDGAVYSYDPALFPAQRASRIANAPTTCTGVVVTSDKIVIAYGSNFDPDTNLAGGPSDQDLLQYWASAQGDYTDWDVTVAYGAQGSPSVVNRLTEGTRIVGAADLGVHSTLMWTDTAAYRLQYTGSKYVFNTQLVGAKCGLIGPSAFVIVRTEAYWMSPHGLFMYNGGVTRIPNSDDIGQWLIDNLRPYHTVKTLCWHNERFNEVWFAFVPAAATEPTYYVAVNLTDWSWTKGVLPEAMSAATKFTGYDARPILMGSAGKILQLDNGWTANGAALSWFLQTAPLELGSGERWIELNGLAIDMQRQASPIIVQLDAYDRTPAEPVKVDSVTTSFDRTDQVVDARVSGRSLALRFSGTGMTQDFRFGIIKALQAPGAARR